MTRIKTFTGLSVLTDLQQAIGQYLRSRTWMRRTDPDRLLDLAVDAEAADGVFAQKFGRSVAADIQIRLLVVAMQVERVVAWNPLPTTDG